MQSSITVQPCIPNKCKSRDNKFGVTWCIKCGKLFTKPSGKSLVITDIIHIKL